MTITAQSQGAPVPPRKTSYGTILGMPIFEFLTEHPEDASQLSQTMVGFRGAEPAVAAAYDFSPVKIVVDIGGATGRSGFRVDRIVATDSVVSIVEAPL